MDLSDLDVAALERRAEICAIAAGDVLIYEGEPIQSIFLIKSGTGDNARESSDD